MPRWGGEEAGRLAIFDSPARGCARKRKISAKIELRSVLRSPRSSLASSILGSSADRSSLPFAFPIYHPSFSFFFFSIHIYIFLFEGDDLGGIRGFGEGGGVGGEEPACSARVLCLLVFQGGLRWGAVSS